MTEADDTITTKLNVRDLDLPLDGLCFVKGCEKFGTSVGMCRKHYMKWYRYGHPLAHGGKRYYEATSRVYKPGLRERHAWFAMRDRCSNPKARNWCHYGARGITVCARWQDSFGAFFADMGPKPNGLSLERLNVNGNYEPGNCIWGTATQQSRNTRAVRLSSEIVAKAKARRALGESNASIARDLGVPAATLWQALNGRSWKEVEALHGP